MTDMCLCASGYNKYHISPLFYLITFKYSEEPFSFMNMTNEILILAILYIKYNYFFLSINEEFRGI